MSMLYNNGKTWSEMTPEEQKVCLIERTIQDYEAGRSRYYIDTLYKIAEVHHIDIVIEKK